MKPVLHAQPWPHYLSKPRGVASCRELAATCSEAATAGSFFLLFQTEEVWRFFFFFLFFFLLSGVSMEWSFLCCVQLSRF